LCIESNDNEVYKDEKVKVSFILDSDQDDIEGKLIIIQYFYIPSFYYFKKDGETLAELKDFDAVEKRMKKIQKKVKYSFINNTLYLIIYLILNLDLFY
jgi:hypothetical protein